MTTIEILFTPDGEGQCLWTEALPLHALGALKMRRASVVEFNEQRQQWEVRLPDDKITVLFASESRQSCLNWEQQHFNQMLAEKSV